MNRITKTIVSLAAVATIAATTIGANAATFRITDAQLISGVSGVKIQHGDRYENVGVVSFSQVYNKIKNGQNFIVPLKNMEGTMCEGKKLLYIKPSSTDENVLNSEAYSLIKNFDKIIITNNGVDLKTKGYPLQLSYDWTKDMFCVMISSKSIYNSSSIKNTSVSYDEDYNRITVKTTIVIGNVVSTPASIKIGGQTATVKNTYVTYTDSDYAGDYFDWVGGWNDAQTEITVTAVIDAKKWYNSYNTYGAPVTLDGINLGYSKVKYSLSSAISFFVNNFDSMKVLGKGNSCCGGGMANASDTEFCYVQKSGRTLKLWRHKKDCNDLGLGEFNNYLFYNCYYDDIDYIKMYDEDNKCWYNWNVSASYFTPEFIHKCVHNSVLNHGGGHEH